MNRVILLFIYIFHFGNGYTTHIRGAQISYIYLGGNQYEFTVVTCTKLSVLTDKPVLAIYYDGSADSVYRVSQLADTAADCLLNFYIGTHTFPGSGTYVISVNEGTRTSGIINIPNSVNTGLCVSVQLNISPFFTNHSAKLDPFPCPMYFCQSQNNCGFISATDPDGDSLSFELINCLDIECDSVGLYQLPGIFGGNFTLDQITGEICWDSPTIIGDYNIAVKIHEWKLLGPTGRVNIGYVMSDFQLKVISGCVAAVENSELNNEFKIYPNPFTNSITIEGSETITSVKIYDITGKLITTTSPNSMRCIIELDVERGAYVIEVFSDEKKWLTKLNKM